MKDELLWGEINLWNLTLWRTIDGGPHSRRERIPWLRLRHNARRCSRGGRLREVTVAWPVLRLRHRADGTWNLQGLLASPWPGPAMETPPIMIQNGTVELAESDTGGVAILRDVSVKVESAGPKQLQFDGTAQGDAFDRLHVQGTIDLGTGRVTLGGDLERLALSETLRERLPAELRPKVKELALTGEVDLRVGHVVYDPAATPRSAIRSPRAPLGIVEVPQASVPDQRPLGEPRGSRWRALDRAGRRLQRQHGRPHPSGTVVLGDPERAALDLRIDILDLELDQRLRDWTPKQHDELWDIFARRAAERGPADRPRARGRTAGLRHAHRLPRRGHRLRGLQ